MPKAPWIPIGHRRALNRLLISGGAPPAAVRLAPGQWVRTMRVALRMTQAQLARRARVTQPHVALIESGKVDPGVATLRVIFDALFCDLVVLPIPRRRPGDIVFDRGGGHEPPGRKLKLWD